MSHPKQLKPCGTESAYSRHLKNGEKPCEECRAAHSQYNSPEAKRQREAARLLPKKSVCGTDSGYHRHIRRREQTCDACKEAHAKKKRELNKVKPQVRKPKPFRVSMPPEIFAELYWTASSKALLMLDEHFGAERVDEMIKKAEEL